MMEVAEPVELGLGTLDAGDAQPRALRPDRRRVDRSRHSIRPKKPGPPTPGPPDPSERSDPSDPSDESEPLTVPEPVKDDIDPPDASGEAVMGALAAVARPLFRTPRPL